MRNAEFGFKVVKPHGSKKSIKDLTFEEKAFCEYIIDGLTAPQAAEKAGLYKDVPEDKFADRAYYLSQTSRVKKYIQENGRVVKLYDDRDMDLVRTKMLEIALGKAVRTKKVVTKDGAVIDVEENPSFRDQIAAAAFLRNDFNDRKNEVSTNKSDAVLAHFEDIDNKNKKFLDQYTYRPMEKNKQDPFALRIADRGKAENNEPDIEGFDSEKNEKVFEDAFRDYTVQGN